MVDPKTSLAVDAPPLAPYDDGFSTESEDLEDLAEGQYNELHIAVSAAVGRVAVDKNQPKAQQVPRAVKAVNQENKKTQQIPATPAFKTEENATIQAACGLNTTRNGGVKPEEEHCRTCRGYLTPLAERLKAMRLAASQCIGKNPPPSRQCGCCHITYPLVALTDESRRRSWPEPRCYMCYWAARAAKKAAGASVSGVKRETNRAAKAVEPGGGDRARDEGDECCKSCKKKLTPLEQRVKMMKEAVLLHKGRGPPASRQCSCCRITYPIAALSAKSRALSCSTPVCAMCESSAASLETKTPTPDAVAANAVHTKALVAKKPVEVIELDDDEDGELVEEKECKCCHGQLIPLAKRVQMMADAAREHGGKAPPPSRQCACCRIVYPSAALTAKSRKTTRVVPICLNCCKAGGSTIYEMLAVSDEFVEAFKVENPAMARQLLTRKENGSLAKQVQRQRQRIKPPQAIKKETRVTSQPPSKQAQPVPRATYAPRVMMARKLIGAPRALLGHGMPGSQADASAGVSYSLRPPIMVRKSRNSPRQLLGQEVPAFAPTGEQANGAPSDEAGGTTQPPPQVPPRTSRWLQQFEVVDGKTTRERRLEKRNETKERRLEKKRQRTG